MATIYRFKVQGGPHIHNGRLYSPGSVFDSLVDLRSKKQVIKAVDRLVLVEVIEAPDNAEEESGSG